MTQPNTIGEGSVLWHGTSLDRAAKIMRDGELRVARFGVEAVSMTDDPMVALYFAKLAADTDRGTPVILAIDAAQLRADGFELEPFEDDVWGDGQCAWERETVCWQNIPVKYLTPASAQHLTDAPYPGRDHRTSPLTSSGDMG